MRLILEKRKLWILDEPYNHLDDLSIEILNQTFIDHTNNKYGRHAITIASAGLHKGWKMRREHSSKIDTASFNYLPKVSAS